MPETVQRTTDMPQPNIIASIYHASTCHTASWSRSDLTQVQTHYRRLQSPRWFANDGVPLTKRTVIAARSLTKRPSRTSHENRSWSRIIKVSNRPSDSLCKKPRLRCQGPLNRPSSVNCPQSWYCPNRLHP